MLLNDTIENLSPEALVKYLFAELVAMEAYGKMKEGESAEKALEEAIRLLNGQKGE